jgi:endonuclease/exonuclease/phosphatase family metal-dependent hydrolase
MHTIKIAFANISQGLVYEGKKGRKDVFSKYWPSAYQSQYVALHPDIVCLAEVPLDDERGSSSFLQSFAQAMGAVSCQADVHEKSWLVEGKYSGNAILSRFELSDYHVIKLPNPRLEVDRPDGQHWVLHDKSAQSATVHVDGQAISLINLHYFPFFLFRRKLNDAELAPSRAALVELLHLGSGVPAIVAGDFNNNDDELEVAFPEFFQGGGLETAVRFGPEQFDKLYCGRHQMDHILYTPQVFSVLEGQIIRDASDHRGIFAELELRQ